MRTFIDTSPHLTLNTTSNLAPLMLAGTLKSLGSQIITPIILSLTQWVFLHKALNKISNSSVKPLST